MQMLAPYPALSATRHARRSSGPRATCAACTTSAEAGPTSASYAVTLAPAFVHAYPCRTSQTPGRATLQRWPLISTSSRKIKGTGRQHLRPAAGRRSSLRARWRRCGGRCSRGSRPRHISGRRRGRDVQWRQAAIRVVDAGQHAKRAGLPVLRGRPAPAPAPGNLRRPPPCRVATAHDTLGPLSCNVNSRTPGGQPAKTRAMQGLRLTASSSHTSSDCQASKSGRLTPLCACRASERNMPGAQRWAAAGALGTQRGTFSLCMPARGATICAHHQRAPAPAAHLGSEGTCPGGRRCSSASCAARAAASSPPSPAAGRGAAQAAASLDAPSAAAPAAAALAGAAGATAAADAAASAAGVGSAVRGSSRARRASAATRAGSCSATPAAHEPSGASAAAPAAPPQPRPALPRSPRVLASARGASAAASHRSAARARSATSLNPSGPLPAGVRPGAGPAPCAAPPPGGPSTWLGAESGCAQGAAAPSASRHVRSSARACAGLGDHASGPARLSAAPPPPPLPPPPPPALRFVPRRGLPAGAAAGGASSAAAQRCSTAALCSVGATAASPGARLGVSQHARPAACGAARRCTAPASSSGGSAGQTLHRPRRLALQAPCSGVDAACAAGSIPSSASGGSRTPAQLRALTAQWQQARWERDAHAARPVH